MASSSLKRNDTFFIDIDSTHFIEKFNKRAEDFKGRGGAFERAMVRMIPLVEAEFKAFVSAHNQTGDTVETLMKPEEAVMYWGDNARKKWSGTTTKGIKGFTGGHVVVKNTEHILFLQYGFKQDFKYKNQGLPAVFLDVGRPGIKYKNGTVSKEMRPTFFIFYTIERNIKKFNAFFREEVMKELGDLV